MARALGFILGHRDTVIHRRGDATLPKYSRDILTGSAGVTTLSNPLSAGETDFPRVRFKAAQSLLYFFACIALTSFTSSSNEGLESDLARPLAMKALVSP